LPGNLRIEHYLVTSAASARKGICQSLFSRLETDKSGQQPIVYARMAYLTRTIRKTFLCTCP
jgi:hypothetical protein